MTALAWLSLAAAILLCGPVGTAGRPSRRARRPGEPRLSPRALRAVAVGAAVLMSVALLGPGTGLPVAAALAPAAAWGAGRLAARPARAEPAGSLPLALDLVAAALRCGQAVGAAFLLGSPVLSEPRAARWQRAAGLLTLGADPPQAWAALAADRALAPVAAVAHRSADSGVRLARALTQLAADTRAGERAAALARAERVGVQVMAPLGLCFLPAFVCLGIVPTIVGVARGVLGGLP